MNARQLVEVTDRTLRSASIPSALVGWGADALEVGRNLRRVMEGTLLSRGRATPIPGTGLSLTAEAAAPRIAVRGGAPAELAFADVAEAWDALTSALRAAVTGHDPIVRACAEVRIAALDAAAALRAFGAAPLVPPDGAGALASFEDATGAPWPLASTLERVEPTLATSLGALNDGHGPTPMRIALLSAQLSRQPTLHWALVLADRDAVMIVGRSGKSATAREALWPAAHTALFSAAPALAAARLIANHGLELDEGLNVQFGALFVDGDWE
jgi:hypothetical protein